jgi:hypothetical protein
MNLTDYVSVEQLQGFVRHVLTTAGGAVVATGYVSSSDWTTIGGAVAVAAGVIWSYIDKKVKENETTTSPTPSA